MKGDSHEQEIMNLIGRTLMQKLNDKEGNLDSTERTQASLDS